MKRRRGIIFVHGIVGNNRIFDLIVSRVPDDWEIRFVTLEGHGGDALSFSHASMGEWKRQVSEAVEELSMRCDGIIGVGHSMGCLLLMHQAAGGKLSGLFLMNPPLRIKLRSSLLENVIKVAGGITNGDPVAEAAKDAYGVSFDFNPLHYYGWPKRYFELFREIAYVRANVVGKIQCPVRAILSDKDEMVSIASQTDLRCIPNLVIRILPNSTHYYYSEKDRLTICEEFDALVGMEV